jgi:hypothetical protein
MFIGGFLMTELFGLMLHPSGALVWSGSGQVVALVLAGALLLAAAGLFLVREPAKTAGASLAKRADFRNGDRCLPRAA